MAGLGPYWLRAAVRSHWLQLLLYLCLYNSVSQMEIIKEKDYTEVVIFTAGSCWLLEAMAGRLSRLWVSTGPPWMVGGATPLSSLSISTCGGQAGPLLSLLRGLPAPVCNAPILRNPAVSSGLHPRLPTWASTCHPRQLCLPSLPCLPPLSTRVFHVTQRPPRTFFLSLGRSQKLPAPPPPETLLDFGPPTPLTLPLLLWVSTFTLKTSGFHLSGHNLQIHAPATPQNFQPPSHRPF